MFLSGNLKLLLISDQFLDLKVPESLRYCKVETLISRSTNHDSIFSRRPFLFSFQAPAQTEELPSHPAVQGDEFYLVHPFTEATELLIFSPRGLVFCYIYFILYCIVLYYIILYYIILYYIIYFYVRWRHEEGLIVFNLCLYRGPKVLFLVTTWILKFRHLLHPNPSSLKTGSYYFLSALMCSSFFISVT